MGMATGDTTMARGPLMLRLRLRLSPPPLLSPDMAIMAMGTDTTLTDTDTLLLTPTDIILATARGLLMLSPHMVIMGTEDTVEDTMVMVMVMVMATDTTVEKFQKFMLIQSDFRVQYK